MWQGTIIRSKQKKHICIFVALIFVHMIDRRRKIMQHDKFEKIDVQRYRHQSLMIYDAIILIFVDFLILGVYPSSEAKMPLSAFLIHIILSVVSIFGCRCFAGIYKQIWRYGGVAAYILLIMADVVSGIVYLILQTVFPVYKITFIHMFSIVTLNLLLTLSIRLIYRYLYEYSGRSNKQSCIGWRFIEVITGLSFISEDNEQSDNSDRTKIRIAIIGAGRVGVMLAEELLNNPRSSYIPSCFIDVDKAKIGREISGIPILSSDEATSEKLAALSIQEVVFALPQISAERMKELYDHYNSTGCKVKVYDFPVMQTAENGKRHMREFDIEELLFRKPIDIQNEKNGAYYKDKVVLITGGGGSIGSELCRQVARMSPESLIILDIYENGAYEIQQELRMAYGGQLDVYVEIVSICDRAGFEKVISTYRPDIILHAAAHKHVPLMEHNCCEAVKNNVFGTLNAVELAEKYNVGRFIMISTDKAVNPTNVMGATKRMCEMIVQSHSISGSSTIFSATRFGNVLGSAGSVIPLFKKQIMNGGPLTITDKRIIRYFMTIPEASQLVLQSGAMAKNGELFVLDMGKPVKILELAENMIRLSGYEPYFDIDIVETGLRPGEKLYEELLIRTEELDKTENSLIFIERDNPLPLNKISNILDDLRIAIESEDDAIVKRELKKAVPTFHSRDEFEIETLLQREGA